jgi:hypothetical protein
MSDYDRGSAALTPAQREYLRGESDIENNSSRERAIRARLRERLRYSILDLALVQNSIEPDDLEGAFEDPELTEDNYQNIIHIFNQAASVFALMFDGLSRNSKYAHATTSDTEVDERMIEMFESYVSDGLEKMYNKRGLNVEGIDVAIEVDLGDSLTELAEHDLSTLSRDELDQLLYAGEITFDEYTNALEQVLGTEIKQATIEPDKFSE